jgi:hypothetical protein
VTTTSWQTQFLAGVLVLYWASVGGLLLFMRGRKDPIELPWLYAAHYAVLTIWSAIMCRWCLTTKRGKGQGMG